MRGGKTSGQDLAGPFPQDLHHSRASVRVHQAHRYDRQTAPDVTGLSLSSSGQNATRFTLYVTRCD
jgi:hypothetical protein